MALTRLNSFSKKPSDMPSVPSPSMSPDDIRSLWETPLDEILENIQKIVDDVNSTEDGDSGADNVGATGFDGADSTVQTMLETLNNSKATNGGDWSGTWQGYTPSKADPGISSVVEQHTAQLAEQTTLTKPYNAYKNIVYGQEHLSAFHKKIMAHNRSVANLKIDWIGDSTTYGVNTTAPYHLDALFTNMLLRDGLNYIDNINNGVSGSTTAWWSDTDQAYVTTRDIPLAPDLAIIRYGINDANASVDTSSYEYYLRQGLQKFRNAFTSSQMSIVLMSPNCLDSATYPEKSPAWNKAINDIIRQAAEDFQCCFIDTFALWQDAANAGDFMDADVVHPADVFNLWIASKIYNVVFPTALRAKFGIPKVIYPTLQNGWANFGNGYQAAGYYIDKSNIVHLHGLIASGTIAKDTVLFTLNAGYRPYSAKAFSVVTEDGTGAVVLGCIFIQTDGNVTIQAGANGWFSLEGVSFLVSDEYTM